MNENLYNMLHVGHTKDTFCTLYNYSQAKTGCSEPNFSSHCADVPVSFYHMQRCGCSSSTHIY